ncbi:hypothetical protein Jab_2c28630 [Janthinobacterium sp. HH01]|uniref:hypothetical protein n=1 Tax=Janthinobacterium sp. HH01 TaxID=1198452 RepID=UPI0002AEB927|nr:hypothetical protein [Janthinobacterium sp. HH01]ELX10763.1 hypothetical protein Jab_2c28630 [Janthinobacterium sp. HH01]
MSKIIALASFMLLAPCVVQAADPELFHLAVADVPVESGKVLNIEFQEVVREAETSIVQVTRRSGGSVSSSMFILRGMCGLARARGKKNFVPEQVVGDTSRFTVTFPDTPPDPDARKGFTMAQCDLMRY